MAYIQRFFPTAFYEENCLFDDSQNLEWLKKLKHIKEDHPNTKNQWYGGTYTSHGVYDLTKDMEFLPLISKITECVNDFAKEYNSFEEYFCQNAFFNFSNAENFQEFHHHQESIFSAVYYISSPTGSADIVFQSPNPPDMLPPKNIKHKNELTFDEITFPSESGKLIIFRSNIKHCVTQGTNQNPRVSIAMNFR
jgi:uncharacterized protein (TIGR02466 family)